jgi:hypothetical protein
MASKRQLNISPIIPTRAIRPLTRLLLFVRAGGRCEFDGCNKDLLRHHLTLTEGNFAQIAHIVAFRQDGPRGNTGRRPTDINDVRNLMLLCPECHKLIDDLPVTIPAKRSGSTRPSTSAALGMSRHSDLIEKQQP